MSGTSNVNNSGIWHMAFNGQPLCRNRRAHMMFAVDRFRELPSDCQCKRCAKALADMDRRTKRALEQS
jgi:hypothetical protein